MQVEHQYVRRSKRLVDMWKLSAAMVRGKDYCWLQWQIIFGTVQHCFHTFFATLKVAQAGCTLHHSKFEIHFYKSYFRDEKNHIKPESKLLNSSSLGTLSFISKIDVQRRINDILYNTLL